MPSVALCDCRVLTCEAQLIDFGDLFGDGPLDNLRKPFWRGNNPNSHRSLAVLLYAFDAEPSVFSCRKSLDASARSQSRKSTTFGRFAVTLGQTIQ
jgi:hypothetical protein